MPATHPNPVRHQLFEPLRSGALALAVVTTSLVAEQVFAPPSAIACLQDATASVEVAKQPQEVARIAGRLSRGLDSDPIDPFTIYGSSFKKYMREVLEGEKVVERKRGVTVTTCTASVAAAAETPLFQGLPIGEKVRAVGGECVTSEGDELRPTCAASCASACSRELQRYRSASAAATGIVIEEQDVARVQRSCQRQCASECAKPGRAFDFVVPYRP